MTTTEDLKSTLNLPRTDFPMKANLAQAEPKRLEDWERSALYAAVRAARTALADELRVLALPTVWLATLGSTAGRSDELVLAAVVDAELLAVHTAVHDALAGRVRGPVAAYLPSAWLPHCVLGVSRPAAAFAALQPLEPVRAQVVGVEIADARTGEIIAVH